MFTTHQRRLSYEHDRCNLYETNKLRRGFIIGPALFYPVYQIFNHAAKHIYHIERDLRTRPRLRQSLTKLTYMLDNDTALTSTRLLLITLQEHHVQDISSLFDNLRSQHTHLITTKPLIGDPNTDNPQSPLTHALHFVARTTYHQVNTPLLIRVQRRHNNMSGTHELRLSIPVYSSRCLH